ncbi:MULTISPECIES: amino acid adenylation domain-containing protein [unclassified Saccharothrix]|uniref:amino acid adenylation domain-containing protein n=1 Tax=unclassified Saccharothrix TaxID=2593673 RepID=UPI00307D8618
MILPDLVRESARRDGSALAVWSVEGTLTYAELDLEASRVGRYLSTLGVGVGDRVALWLPKSLTAVVAMQAVLRLGAAYVPIDPLSPVERARQVIGDCAPVVVLTTPENVGSVPGAVSVELGGGPVEDLPVAPAAPDDLAYILYTSGSTGVPKGVRISHRNALAFVEWAADELGASPADRFANHAPLHFDLSVLDLYVAFLAGACVVLVPQESAYAPSRLVDLLVSQRITVWYSVPSVLILMARNGLLETALPELRAVLFAGEPYPVDHLRALRAHLPEVRLLNLYGPTETNVCTFYEVGEVPDSWTRAAPIGRACSGDTVWAVRDDGTPAGIGEEGELVVSGPTVMLGYHGRPPHTGPYATGDRVVLTAGGDYIYLGRRDGMVKVRGNRVELGDIEAALQAHPAVSQVAVTVRGTGLEARLVAHVVAVGEFGLLDAKRHCAGLLPRHMIVDEVRLLPTLPRTATGKLDRLALDGAR